MFEKWQILNNNIEFSCKNNTINLKYNKEYVLNNINFEKKNSYFQANYYVILHYLLIDVYVKYKNNRNVKTLVSFINNIYKVLPVYKFENLKIVAFEGERCSGKDTIISKIDMQKEVYFAPRKFSNIAWEELNKIKNNCYFDVGDFYSGMLLWFSDLAYRLHKWLEKSDDRIIIANRYLYSVIVNLISTYDYSKPIFDFINSVFILRGYFISSFKTIILDIDYIQLSERLNKYRNREFMKSECKIAKDNINMFKRISSDDIYIIDKDISLDCKISQCNTIIRDVISEYKQSTK